MRIEIVSVGKTKERWLQEALNQYEKRLRGHLEICFTMLKSSEAMVTYAERSKRPWGLDAAGRQLDSEQFCKLLFSELEEGGARLTFFIGAAEGLPTPLKERLPLLSLSPMTFTHQTARLLLLEQIYRASEIAKGSQYAK